MCRQALGAAREELRAALVRAEQQLVTLTSAIVDWYKNETTVNLIRSRMEEKSKALNEKVRLKLPQKGPGGPGNCAVNANVSGVYVR
jgi:hypothetical protein